MYRILVITNDPMLRESLEHHILWEELGFELIRCLIHPETAAPWLKNRACDGLLVDITGYEESQIQALGRLKKLYPAVEALIISGFETLCGAGRATAEWRFDCLVQPVDASELVGALISLKKKLDRRKTQTASESNILPEPLLIDKIRRYTQEHIGAGIGVEQIARTYHLNPSYLSRLFRQKTGEKLSDYISRIRVEKAMELLKEGNYNTAQVSRLVGCTPSYLSVLFKKYTGCTPSGYRRTGSPE